MYLKVKMFYKYETLFKNKANLKIILIGSVNKKL